MKRYKFRALGALVASLAYGCCVASAAAAPPPPGSAGYLGGAYGTSAHVGTLVVAGPTAPVAITCLTPANTHSTNDVATLTINNVLRTGVVETTADTFAASGSVGDSSSAKVAGISLLGGLIRVSAITAVSSTAESSSGVQTSGDGSNIVGLVIKGKPVNVNVGPNTTIPVPGIGKIVLDEQIETDGANNVQFTVNEIHVYVTVGLPGVRKGTEVIVGHASSGLTLTGGGSTIAGTAYSLSAKVGTVVAIPPAFGVGLAVGMACGATSGGASTNGAARINLPDVVVTGTLQNSSSGSFDPTGADTTGETNATIQHIDLLGGLVKADAIVAQSNASVTPFGVAFNDDGSKIVNLTIAGKKILVANTGPNTKISLGGLTIWLHRLIRTSNSLTVRMLEVEGEAPNLPKSNDLVDIQVGVAETEG